MDPRELQRNLVPEIKERILIIASGYPIFELDETFDQLGEYLQALGISHLLAQADEREFRNNLIRSGHARRYFLSRCLQEENKDDRHLALSRTESVLDCLAAGNLAVSREIAERSVSDYNPDWEYEDDEDYE